MEMTDQTTFDISARSGKDRRNRSGFTIRSLLFGGRREKIRRQEDTRRIFYVDRYNPKLFVAIVAILSLSIIDGFLTLFLLDHGAYETNPVMAYFLEFGPYTFFTFKFILTIIPAIGLLMFRNIFLAPIRIYTHSLLYLIVAMFMAVVGWELYLVSVVGS